MANEYESHYGNHNAQVCPFKAKVKAWSQKWKQIPHDSYQEEFSKYLKQNAENVDHVERMFSSMILELNSFPSVQQASLYLEKTAKKISNVASEPSFPDCRKCSTTGIIFFYDTLEHREMIFLCDCKMGQYFASIRKGFFCVPHSITSDSRYFKGSKNQYDRKLLFAKKQ